MDFPKSVPGIGLVNGQFVDEDATTGRVGSLIPASWGNSITQEVIAALVAAGMVADETKSDQLRDAILRLAATGVTSIAAAGVTNLTAANCGLVLVNAAAGNVTINLPAANAMNGLRFNFVRIDNVPANSVTINRTSTDTIDGVVLTSFKLVGQYDRRAIRGNGAGTWYTESTGFSSACRAYQNATQSISAATFTKVTLQAKTLDNGAEFDTATYRFTAKQAGLYQVNGGVSIASPGNGSGYFGAIYVNGALVERGTSIQGSTNPMIQAVSMVSAQIYLNAGDYVELYAYGDAGFSTTSGSAVTRLSLARIQ